MCNQHELPDVYRSSFVKARKQYKCCECGDLIAVGETYQKADGLWDGIFRTFHTCESCSQVWLRLQEEDVVECFVHGKLSETISDCDLFDTEEESVFGRRCAIATSIPWLKRRRGGRWIIVDY